jgi:hypothetical protein
LGGRLTTPTIKNCIGYELLYLQAPEELHSLYSSPDITRQIKSRRMRWAGHVAHMEEERKVYRVLVGKPEGKRPLVSPRHKWEDVIRMDLREIKWDHHKLETVTTELPAWSNTHVALTGPTL